MTSTTKAAHTPAAMRAGECLSRRFRKMGGMCLSNTNAELLAGIIDAETGLPEMLEALEAVLSYAPHEELPFTPQVRAAIKKAKGGQ